MRIAGTVAVQASARVALAATGCSAGTDDISSYGWSPEHHRADRQAVPGFPAYQQSGARFALRLSGRRSVSYSATVGYAFLDLAAPGWTDCVTLSLAREARDGADSSSAFDSRASTLYVSVGLRDGRHVACGPAPAFCSRQRTAELLPPALPAFPPAPGYPGSAGHGNPPGDVGRNYPYHVCGTAQTGGPSLCSAEQAAAQA